MNEDTVHTVFYYIQIIVGDGIFFTQITDKSKFRSLKIVHKH